MMKQLSIAMALVFAVACKTDAPSAKPAPADTSPSARSAKIDVKAKSPPPKLPAQEASSAEASDQATEGDPSEGEPRTYPVVQTEVPTTTEPAISDPDEIRRRNVWRKRRKLDLDGDGVLSEDEREAEVFARMAAMHTRYDDDGDGRLTADELAKAQGRMRFDNPGALDTDRDGDISPDELQAGFKSRREQRRRQAGVTETADNAGGTGSTP